MERPSSPVETRRSGNRFAEMVEALSSPAAYPQPVDRVQVLQTHISVLFFAGERVYKLKKPVKLDFLDYSDVEKRRRFCEEEVRLNGRISPRMYLGVLPVTREQAGGFLLDGDGATVDWVVEMVRLPDDRMLDALLDRGEIDADQLKRIAVVLAKFHDRAMTGPTVNRHALVPAVKDKVTRNIDELESAATGHPGLFPEEWAGFLRERAARFLRDRRGLLEERLAAWRIREGHGDLHAGNVCLLGDEVYVYDCVEFDRALRCGDVASDLAFLAMDLEHRGHRDEAGLLIGTYAEIASDPRLDVLVGFYKTYRALVRAKVELLKAQDDSIAREEREASIDEARSYLHLAAGYELSPCLILTCGLPATGKSHSAAHLGGRFRAAVLRSDALREGGGESGSRGSRYGEGRYSPRERERVYERMLELASGALSEGRSVVADATFARESFRRPFLDAATRLGIPCYALMLEVPERVARERLRERRRSSEEPSEADLEVYLEESKRFEIPEEFPQGRLLELSGTDEPSGHCHALQERMILEQGS